MKSEQLLQLLRAAGDSFLSGEAMSRELKVSRAAVWKQISALREAGYQIEAVSNRGYRLVGEPEKMNQQSILESLGDHPWADRVRYYDSVGSTNTILKQLAEEGAPSGTVLLAGEQTGGRGRLGRSFASPKDVGIYLSLLLRPELPPEALSHVTALAAVATEEAIAATTGVRAGIKWPNDLVVDKKKLCGILTELSVEWDTMQTQYVIIGIGINCNQSSEDFAPELSNKAVSLKMLTEKSADRNLLAANLIRALSEIDLSSELAKQVWLERYRRSCINVGCRVRVVMAGKERTGIAREVDDDFALIVDFDDGSTETVMSGEVSVRGIYGYSDI